MEQQEELKKLLNMIPAERKAITANMAIHAYTADIYTKRFLYKFCGSSSITLEEMVRDAKFCSEYDYKHFVKFVKWFAFDIGADAVTLAEDIFNNSRYQRIIQWRMQNYTTKQIAAELGLTYSRVNQILKEMNKHIVYYNSRQKIIMKIFVVNNGQKKIPTVEVERYLSKYPTEMLYLLQTTKNPYYYYDNMLDAFIVREEPTYKDV